MSLASLLEGDPIPLIVKQSLLADVVCGLQFLHTFIVHKRSNCPECSSKFISSCQNQ